MDNIIFKDGKYKFNGLVITKDDYGYDLEFSSTPIRSDKKYIYLLSLGLDNKENLSIGTNPEFTVDEIINIFSLRDKPAKEYESFLHDYSFPPIYNERKPFIKLDGLFSNNKSSLSVVFPKKVTSYGPLEPIKFNQEGVTLVSKSNNELVGSMDYNLLKLNSIINKTNQTWKTSNLQERYKLIQDIQKISDEGKFDIASQLKQKIVSPEKIVPRIEEKDGTHNITAGLDIKELNQQDFKQRLEGRIEADNIYTVEDENGEQVKVLLSDEQKQILQDIKNLEDAPEEELKDFIKMPPENWNDEIVDMSDLYSDRVNGWIYYVDDSFDIKSSGTDWFGDEEAIFLDPSITLDSKEGEKKIKKNLDLKDNESDLDYEEELHQAIKGYTFPEILGGYKDGIEPKDYQKEGIAWMYSLYQKQNPGCILADDMGLGKTFQVLSFLQAISDKPQLSLIVAPASLLENWEDEYYHFFKECRYRIVVKNKSFLKQIITKQTQEEDINQPTIIITNYENLRGTKEYLAIKWDVVILDEAQRIKNSSSLTNRTARGLKTNFRIALTGTPVENTFEDIWAISDFANPGLMGTLRWFKQKFNIGHDTADDVVKDIGIQIREKLGFTFLRRTKDEMLKNLPEKECVKITQMMPDHQEDIYKACLASHLKAVQAKDVLLVLQRLRKVSDHYSLLPQFDEELYDFKDTAKTILVKNILDGVKAKNEKAIIFAEYIKTQEILATLIYEEYGIRPSIYNGQVAIGRRKELLDRFKQSDGFNVIIMSPIAAGVGLTITEANHVIHYSRHWNPAREEQATDRAYRIGQTKKVYVYNLIGTIDGITTFDQNLDKLLSRKNNIKGAALFPSNRLEITKKDLAKSLLVKN